MVWLQCTYRTAGTPRFEKLPAWSEHTNITPTNSPKKALVKVPLALEHPTYGMDY